MMAKIWKPNQRPTSAAHGTRLCLQYANVKLNRSVERVADMSGVTHDSLYKWQASGRMPLIVIPAFEHACGCNYVSEWLAASSGKVAISIPTGRAVKQGDLVELNTGFGAALQLLADLYNTPQKADVSGTLDALTRHLQQVAWHHANVGQFATPELEF